MKESGKSPYAFMAREFMGDSSVWGVVAYRILDARVKSNVRVSRAAGRRIGVIPPGFGICQQRK
jgi:hypothetical protein